MTKKILLDFSDFYEDRYEYSRTGPTDNILTQEYRKPNDVSNFFKKRGFCPFCMKNIPEVFNKTDKFTMGKEMWTFIKVWECDSCKWWEYSDQFSEEEDHISELHTQNSDILRHGIVKKFNIGDKQIPINTLIDELMRTKEILYSIDPYKFEEIAQHVFSAYFNCEVKHVGQTGDGGIDLIIVLSDDPILVQVKRRTSANHIELVSGIREFIGSMYIKDARKGIFLSTAKDFSKGAKETVNDVLNNRKFDFFELKDFKSFCDMLSVLKTEDYKPWNKFIK
ncbi:restriction endonuclease [Paenibacillus sp. FSL K6-1122]|uniref:Restriction endonuclease n=1 Tax=Paenibacillus amylolyticus TaxID=1451 RepID=A0ABD8AYQ0_PAEAM